MPLPTFIKFENFTKSFSINSANNSDSGLYTVAVTATSSIAVLNLEKSDTTLKFIVEILPLIVISQIVSIEPIIIHKPPIFPDLPESIIMYSDSKETVNVELFFQS